MDFYNIRVREIEKGPNKGQFEIYPDFKVGRSTDLMVRGRAFYAIWDEAEGLWSTDEYDVRRLVDEDLKRFAKEKFKDQPVSIRWMESFGSGSWKQFRQFVQLLSDNSHQLDEKLTFANTEVKKGDYVSRRLAYDLAPGTCSAWDELVGTLYSVEERAKIEWNIGAIVSGDSKKIQKFVVFYGPPASGKSTILNVYERLFAGYTTTFEAKALGSSNHVFATEVFKNNPLVAIQHDGDLSKIEDNARLNSIISHEEMQMNEKYKPSYTAKVNAFLVMGTNQPVRISDAKSGIIRRLIDIHPTGVTIPINHYHTLMSQIDFELGAIAYHCLQVYQSMGKNYYNKYRPLEMMLQTDVFFNFIEANFDIFKAQDSTSLKQAYQLYKEYCADTGIDRVLPQYKVREELRNYFDEFKDRGEVDGQVVRSFYSGFNANKFKSQSKKEATFSLVMEDTESLFDREFADCPAQGATKDETPKKKWEHVASTLGDVNTRETHFVKVPENHIVIDFDLRDESGEKSLDRNLEAASGWPATYAELSKSGSGVHLHYNYDGDVRELNPVYSDGIEVKTLLGNASLRRRLSKCNSVPIATISSGLPLKEKKKMLSKHQITSEKGLRDMIARNLRKEIHPGTKPSIDFIHNILDEVYDQGLVYDVEDLKPKIMAFANNSTNQAMYCLKVVQKMKWKSELSGSDYVTPEEKAVAVGFQKEQRLVFYDVEVYPNLFIVCWKYQGDATVVRMRNPSAPEVEELFSLKLVGFNNRRYDNHILYARYLGYDNEALYKLSQKIINNERSALFGEAYNLSYADVYDFMAIKQTLKKTMIELGLPHMEMEIPWDQPVPEEMIEKVEEYCCNDVLGTEAAFESRKGDFVARQILADLSGLTVNDTTQKHTAKILFGNDRHPQAKFKYTNLSEEFPGYEFNRGKSSYRGEDPSEGGYVYAEPGMYENVAVLDVASMHPNSIIQLNLFGDYTPKFQELMDARLAIKRGDYDSARQMVNGRLAVHLEDTSGAKALADALKIVINTVYGLTAAKFENPFRDPRNMDNIVAKRGALFMIDLKYAVQEKGFQVVHIKTDSIKIPNATEEIIKFVSEFGEKYGYTFEHETTYDKFCLVNDAVYIARKDVFGKNKEIEHIWDAVGAQFQHPVVYKTLFSHEVIDVQDYYEFKQVSKGAMYIDFEHDKPEQLREGMHFIGRSGLFIPVIGESGGVLYRVVEDKSYAVSGTKGHLWMEAEMFEKLDVKVEIDMSYFEKLINDAIETINKFGNFEEFVNG